MNYFDVLFAKKQSGGGETPTLITKTITANGTYNASADNADGYSSVTVAVEGFKKKSIANTPTDIASFNDGTANPMPSLEISINPVQSGSGDPSPQNRRPISGWSGANIYTPTKNLFPAGYRGKGYINNKYLTSGASVDNTLWFVSPYIPINPNIEYVISGLPSEYATTPAFEILDVNFTTISKTTYNNRPSIVFTAPNNAKYIRLSVQRTQERMYMVEEGDVATPYEPCTTYSIPFHDSSDNPITVYEGRLNVTSGELTATHANIASYNGETINEPWISSMDVYSAGITPTTGAQVVYPLAAPQTYQLTPTQVTTLLNQNNIFADCGQILEGEYFVTL